MSITHHQTEQQFIYLTEDGIQAGRLAYRYLSPMHIDAYSTRVAEAFQGKGIAGALYQALIEFAQAEKLKIKPSCSYIEKKMAHSHRELMG